MTEFNVQQKQFIQEYKANHNLENKSDEQIMLFIQKDMKTNGVVYPGFESLVKPQNKPAYTGQIFGNSTTSSNMAETTVKQGSATLIKEPEKEIITDENGNEVAIVKNGDEIVEATLSQMDSSGNKLETVVSYKNGKPVKQIKKQNGNVSSVTKFTYNEPTENKPFPSVTVETIDGGKNKIITTALETDEYGNVDQEDFISRKTISRDGTETTVIIGSECIKEDKVKIDGKKVSTLYKGTNLADFDSHKLHRVVQETEIDGVKRYAEYDGKGNTKTTVQNGESPALIAQKFNVKEQSLMRLNPQKGKNAITQVGADILIPGEFNADSYPMRVRKSKAESLNKYSQFEARRLAKEINSGEVENVKLSKTYNNVYELAKDNLIKSGVKNPSNQQVNDEANKLILLNGKNVNLKAGASVKVAKSLTNSKQASELTKYGFQASAENRIFFQKFNALNSQQKQNVLSAIQYCKSQKITNPSDIKAKVLETLGINLFDSDKTVPMVAANNYGVMAYQRNSKPISIETFVKDHLKLDIKSEPGKTVLDRLSQVDQAQLNKISAKDFKSFNNKTLDGVASMLETVGVQIRTQAEINVKNNTPRVKAEKEKRAVRTAAAENIALAYDNAINVIKNYQGNQGWINIGFYREKLGQLLDKVNPTDVATCFDAVIKRLEKEKQFAVSRLKTASANESEFKQAFKDLTGKDYNENAVKNFLAQAQKGGDWSKSYDQAFGDKVVKRATDKVNFQQYVDGAGDIVLMLLGTEAIGKGVAWAGGKIAAKLAPYVPKVLSKLGAKGIMTIGNSTVTVGKVVGNMATSAATFTAWDATKNYINLKTKDIQYTGEDAVKEWQAYKEGNVESGKFGAFAGLLNSTVVGKVVNGTMKIFEKPVAKALQGVTKTLEKGEATGADVMKTFIAKQTPGMLAQTAGAVAEVAGFTMYETANEITKELLQTDSNGQRHLPKDLTEEGLTNYLWKHLKGQAANLGEIKAISKLIFMHKGAIAERERIMNENLSKCEMLGKVKIQKAEVDGAEIYAITTPNGNRKIARSPEDVVAYCNVLMQMDMAMNSKVVAKGKSDITENINLERSEVRRSETKSEVEIQNVAAKTKENIVQMQQRLIKELETAENRESFVAIREEIKKLPQGNERTKLIEAYLQKYNAWSMNPNRPDIRMQYIPEEINTQNTLAEFQTFDNLLLNAPKADIKVEEMDEYLRMNRYSEEDIARLKEALGDDYAKCINIRKFAKEIFGDSMGPSGVDDLIEAYNQIPAEQKPLMDLLNRTSIDFLCSKLCISIEEVLDIVFGGNGDSAEVVRKCYDLSRKTGVSIRDLTNSIGNNQEELLDNVTPEKVLAYKQMSDVLSLGGFSYGILNDIAAIKNPEKITKEFLEDYKDTINRFAELGIYGYKTGIDPVEQLTKLKAIEKQLKENNIDLSWYSDSNQGLKIYLKQLENIMQSKDISKISEFLSSCSDECKYNHANDILQFAQDCYMSNPKELAEMLNIIDKVPNGKDAFWGLREMIDKQIKEGTFDINGVKEVAQAFIDTGLWLKDGSNAYAFFAYDYSTQKPNYKGMAKFIRELKEFYNENSEYSIDAYMHEAWRGGHFDSMEQKFKQLKELGLYGKVAPHDLRCLLENANNENTFNLIVAFHNEPLVKNEIYYYEKSSVEVLTKSIDNLKKIIEENNTEYNNISLNEKIELIRALNERNEFYGFLRPHFSNIDKMSIKNLVEGKEDFALQIFNNPEYKASNLNMADKVAIFRESNENNESNILNLITRFKDTKRSNDVFSTRGLILDILRSEKLNWFMSQDLNALDNFVSELYDKSMKNREEFVNNPKDNSDTVEFFRRSYKQLIFLAANNSKEGVEALLKTKQIPDVNKYLNTFYSFDKSELDLFKKMYNSNKPEQIAEIIDIISFLQTDIKEMYLGGKIELLEKISHVSDEVLNSCRKYSDVNVDAKIEELTTSLGKKRDIVIIPFKQQQLFVKNILANNNPNVEKVLKTFDFEQYDKKGLPLEYPREEFTANVEKIIKDLSIEEQVLVLSHFGLERGEAGFDGLPNNKTFANSKVSPKANEVAKLVKAEIEKFTTNNTIKTGDKTVDEVLNGLIQGLPEFTLIVGKKQHGTHAYSVDIHTLKVLQSAMNNPLYEKLSDRDKTILKISALCHDFGKRGGVVDEGHANLSAEYVASILDKFSFPQGMKDRIIDIVENHHWFEKYNTGRATAEDVAVRCRRPEDFIIYEILAKSDFENVNKTFHIERSGGVNNQVEFNRYMQEKMVAIDKALALMYSKSNLIFDTQFMQNGERFPRENAIIDGEQMELKVLDLNKLEDSTDLQQFGFSKGVTKDNARFTIHMTSPNKSNMESVTILTQNSMNNSAWSTSLIKASNNRTYGNKRFGFILDVDQANISEAYYENTGSGCGKDINVFKTILFEQNDAARTYVKSHLMQELYRKGVSLTNEEYSQLSKILMSKKYTTQITKDIKIGDKVIKASDLKECLEKSRDALFFGGDIHSEIVSINPRVKGLIAKVERLEDCPEEFLKFAKEHNLPIILMKPTKAT